MYGKRIKMIKKNEIDNFAWFGTKELNLASKFAKKKFRSMLFVCKYVEEWLKYVKYNNKNIYTTKWHEGWLLFE